METAQPVAAENTPLSIDQAVSAMLPPQEPEKPRDEKGRFAAQQQAEAQEAPEQVEPNETDAPEAEAAEGAEGDAGQPDAEEAADEAQPDDAIPLPASWSKEDEAEWQSLPAQAKAKIFAREAQRDAAVNAKFQEAANARKAAEAEAHAAAQHRTQLVQQIEAVASLIQPQAPDRSMLDPNSHSYDPEGYMRAKADFEDAQGYLGQLQQQRAALVAQQEREEHQARQAEWQEYAPQLLADIPELTQPEKAAAVEAAIYRYATSAGFPPELLAQVSARETHILWKAMQYDQGKAAAQRVKAQAKPQPKPSGPVVKPGVPQPASATKTAEIRALSERLERSGSIEDAVRLSLALSNRK